MAGFNLNAKLNITGPYNVRPVVQALKSQLSGINANINVKLNPGTANGINNVTSAVRALDTALKTAGQSTATLRTNLSAISGLFNNAASSINRSANAMNNINNQSKRISSSLRGTTSDMEKFGKEAGMAVKRAGAFALATGGIFGLIRAMESGISKAIEFEKGVVKLTQVTKTSKAGLKGLTDEIDRLAIGLGTSSSELLEVAKIFTQAGLSINETKIAMEAVAKSTLAPSFDNIINTTEGLIAIVGQFKDEMTGAGIGVKDFEKVLGSINRVSADFAVEADDIVSAIRKTGGVFAAASRGIGTPIDQLNELIAVFTSVRATTRESADSIATGLRTIFTRLQRPQTIEMLKELGIELQDFEGKFVGPYKAIQLLGKAFSTVDTRSPLFAQVTEELGGIRQIGKLIPAIKQYAEAQNVLRTAQEGQDSLTEDSALAQESLSNRIAKTREEFLKLIRDLSNTTTFQNIVRGSLSVADGFIRIADSVKELLPLLTAMFAIRGLSAYNNFTKGFVGAFVGQKRSNGGRIGFNTGGLVPGYGDTDTVPAQLTPGEFVIRKKAVEAIGVENLQKLNKGGYARKYASGSIDGVGSRTPEEKRLIALRQAGLFSKYNDRGQAALDELTKTGKYGTVTIDDYNAIKTYNQSTTSKSQAARVDNKKGSLVLGGEGYPKFGGVFLKPSPGVDFNSTRKKERLGSLVSSDSEIQYLNKRFESTGITLDKDSPVYSKFALGFIESSISKEMEDELSNQLYNSTSNLVQKYGSGFNIPNNDISKKIVQQSGLETATGVMFESMVNVLSNNLKDRNDVNFDIVGNKSAIERLFGPIKAEYIDVKRSFDNSIITGEKSSLFAKAWNTSKQNPSLMSVKLGGVESDFNKVTYGENTKRYANGGIASSDTVPALLTPGEFVINKEAAERIGYSKLNFLNQADKIKGYAGGGVVSNGKTLYGDNLLSLTKDFRQNTASGPQEYQKMTNSVIYLQKSLNGLGLSLAEMKKVAENFKQEFNKTKNVGAATAAAHDELVKIANQKLSIQLGRAGMSTQDFIETQKKMEVALLKQLGSGVKLENAYSRLSQTIDQITTRNKAAIKSSKFNFTDIIMQSRGFGSDYSKQTQDERDKIAEKRNNQLNRIQTVGYGAIGLAATASSFLPDPKTSTDARNQGSLIGAAGGAGIGIEVGSILGPYGAAIGGVVGGLIGGVQNATTSFYEFEKNAALNKMDASLKVAVESIEKIDFSKTIGNIDEFNNAISTYKKNIDIASFNRQQTKDFELTNLVNKLPIFGAVGAMSRSSGGPGTNLGDVRKFIGYYAGLGTIQEQTDKETAIKQKDDLLFRAEKSRDITQLEKRKYIDLKVGSLRTGKELGADKIDFNSIAEGDSRYIKRLNDLNPNDKSFQKNAILARNEVAGLLKKEADQLAKNTIEIEKNAAALQYNKQNLDLLNESLSRAESAMDIFSKKISDTYSRLDTNISRATGGNQLFVQGIGNPFEDIRNSSQNELIGGLRQLKDAGIGGAGFDRASLLVTEGKNALESIKQAIRENFVQNPEEINNATLKIRNSYKGKISDPVLKAEIDAKINSLLPTNKEGSVGGKTAEELNNMLQNIVTEITPSVDKAAQSIAKSLEISNSVLRNTVERDFNIRSKLSSDSIAINDIQSSSALRTIINEEEKTGNLKLGRRYGIQNAQVASLVGSGANVDSIGKRIEELNKQITESIVVTKEDGDKVNDLRIELDKNRKALDILSKNTIKLAAVDAKLAEVQSRTSAATGLTRSFASGNFEDKLNIQKGLSLVAQFKGANEAEKNIATKGILGSPEVAQSFFQGLDLLKNFGQAGQKAAESLERDFLERAVGKDKLAAIGIKGEEDLKAEKERLLKESEAAQIKIIESGNSSLIAALGENSNILKQNAIALSQAFAKLEPLPANTAALINLSNTINAWVPTGKANGGLIRGPGTGTSDSIPTRLSHGEFVIRASSVNSLGIDTLNHINQTGKIPGFSNGGLISSKDNEFISLLKNKFPTKKTNAGVNYYENIRLNRLKKEAQIKNEEDIKNLIDKAKNESIMGVHNKSSDRLNQMISQMRASPFEISDQQKNDIMLKQQERKKMIEQSKIDYDFNEFLNSNDDNKKSQQYSGIFGPGAFKDQSDKYTLDLVNRIPKNIKDIILPRRTKKPNNNDIYRAGPNGELLERTIVTNAFQNGRLPKFAEGGKVDLNQNSNSIGIDTQKITGFLNGFNSGIDRLVTSMNELKQTKIELVGRHEVNVNINGAQVMSGLIPAIQNMITDQVNKFFNKDTDKQKRIEQGK